MGQSLFRKHSKFQTFDEILYCGMARLRNTNLDVFIQCQYTRTILRNKNMGQSKGYSKFQKFNEILYCGMSRSTNVKLGIFRQYQNTKTILKKKVMGQYRFKRLWKFQKLQLSNSTLTWSIEGEMNNVRPDMTYSKELQQKSKCWTDLS